MVCQARPWKTLKARQDRTSGAALAQRHILERCAWPERWTRGGPKAGECSVRRRGRECLQPDWRGSRKRECRLASNLADIRLQQMQRDEPLETGLRLGGVDVGGRGFVGDEGDNPP